MVGQGRRAARVQVDEGRPVSQPVRVVEVSSYHHHTKDVVHVGRPQGHLPTVRTCREVEVSGGHKTCFHYIEDLPFVVIDLGNKGPLIKY